jgi:hypothetical protein
MGDGLSSGVEDLLWSPDSEEEHEESDVNDGRADIDEPRSVAASYDQLSGCEGNTGNENGRPDIHHSAKAREGPDEPEGYENTKGSGTATLIWTKLTRLH